MTRHVDISLNGKQIKDITTERCYWAVRWALEKLGYSGKIAVRGNGRIARYIIEHYEEGIDKYSDVIISATSSEKPTFYQLEGQTIIALDGGYNFTPRGSVVYTESVQALHNAMHYEFPIDRYFGVASMKDIEMGHFIYLYGFALFDLLYAKHHDIITTSFKQKSKKA